MTTAASVMDNETDGAVSHRRVHVGEVTLHIAEVRPPKNNPDAPLVIFLHGFPEFWWSWRHQLEAMHKEGFWGVAPDLRGYNESDKPEGVSEYEVEKLAGDIAGLIRALGRKKAIIVGHDWGAIVAWVFAQLHSDMLERLAILNVPHPLVMQRHLMRSPKQMKKSWYIFFFQLPKIPERFVAKDDYKFMRAGFEADGLAKDEIERYVEAMRVPNALTSAINYYRASIRRVFKGNTPKPVPIKQPVLVIWGDRDRFLGTEMADPPARFVPNARVVHIPEASHWVQNVAPAKVNELLVDFFRQG